MQRIGKRAAACMCMDVRRAGAAGDVLTRTQQVLPASAARDYTGLSVLASTADGLAGPSLRSAALPPPCLFQSLSPGHRGAHLLKGGPQQLEAAAKAAPADANAAVTLKSKDVLVWQHVLHGT